MTSMSENYLSPLQLANRWMCHRSTAGRTMAKCGFPGIKFGEGRGAIRRFLLIEVESVEQIMRRNGGAQNEN